MQQNRSENRQVVRTRNWIFEALIILMKEIPYEEINISAITTKAGVARQSFYRNFKSKEDIIIKFFDQAFLEFVNNSKNVAIKDSEEIYELCFETLYKRKDALLTISNAALNDLLYKILLSYSKYFRKYELQIDDEKLELLHDYFVKYQYGGVLAITMDWIEKGMKETPHELGKISYSICKSLNNNSYHIAELMQFVKQ